MKPDAYRIGGSRGEQEYSGMNEGVLVLLQALMRQAANGTSATPRNNSMWRHRHQPRNQHLLYSHSTRFHLIPLNLRSLVLADM